MTATGSWTDEELRRIGEAVELQLASVGSGGTLRPYVTMWVVRVGDQLFVRSAYGPDNPWYRRATAAGAGRVHAGGVEGDVSFADADPDVQDDIDAAYHAKYDRYGPRIVGTVVGPDAHRVTVRLVPRASTPRTWLITGVSSGFGHELTRQLLEAGERVVGTVRHLDSVADLADAHPETFHPELLNVTDTPAIRTVVDRGFDRLGRIDVVVSNAGYGLFGAAEELTDAQINHIIATNLTGSIQLIRATLPHLRRQGGGRILQVSTYGGQVAFPGSSLYHATKWGIEGFCESVAQEVAPFGIGVTLVEPGGARTGFRYGSAQIADLSPVYADTPAHGFLAMLDPANGLAPGDPARMAAAMIASLDQDRAPLRIMLGSQALATTLGVLKQRIADLEAQTDLAASTDFPPGE